MFTLTSTPVTFIGLLILFAWSLVWSVRDAIKAPTVVTRISTWVHVVMAVTMILMDHGHGHDDVDPVSYTHLRAHET